MNHKRKRPKHQRHGCLMCKPWKDEREAKAAPTNTERRLQADGDNDITMEQARAEVNEDS